MLIPPDLAEFSHRDRASPETTRQARNEYDKTIQETEAMGEKQQSGRKPPGFSKSPTFGPIISGDCFRGSSDLHSGEPTGHFEEAGSCCWILRGCC